MRLRWLQASWSSSRLPTLRTLWTRRTFVAGCTSSLSHRCCSKHRCTRSRAISSSVCPTLTTPTRCARSTVLVAAQPCTGVCCGDRVQRQVRRGVGGVGRVLRHHVQHRLVADGSSLQQHHSDRGGARGASAVGRERRHMPHECVPIVRRAGGPQTHCSDVCAAGHGRPQRQHWRCV